MENCHLESSKSCETNVVGGVTWKYFELKYRVWLNVLSYTLRQNQSFRLSEWTFSSLSCFSIRLVVLGSSQSQPNLSRINKGGWKQNNNIDLRKDVSSVRDADSDAALFCFRRTKRRAAAASAGWLAWKTKAHSLQSFALLTCCCLVVMTPRRKQEDAFSHCDNDRQPRTQTEDYTDSRGR